VISTSERIRFSDVRVMRIATGICQDAESESKATTGTCSVIPATTPTTMVTMAEKTVMFFAVDNLTRTAATTISQVSIPNPNNLNLFSFLYGPAGF
jgi:hypothetical protein